MYYNNWENYRTQLFEFLAQNTDVEFSHLKTGQPNNGTNYIATSFLEGKEKGMGMVFNRLIKAVNKDCNFREWIHSHPKDTNWPSGFNEYTHEYNGTGDMKQVKSLTDNLSKCNWNVPVFKIYLKLSKKYVPYNANSTRYDFR